MVLTDLILMTRVYCRDNNTHMFTDDNIKMFLNQGIDRLRQYKVFDKMSYLENNDDVVNFLPSQYHYLLALFASSRCYDTDERFYEGIEKRNEFESAFSDLINEIENNNVIITDDDGATVDDKPNYIDYVVDKYFNVGDEENDIL